MKKKKKYVESYNIVEFTETPFRKKFLPHDLLKVKICLNNTEIIMLRWCISPEVVFIIVLIVFIMFQ